jgi:signal transduction histidine kinase
MRIPAGLVGAYTWDRSFRLWADGTLTMSVRDYGCGFDPSSVTDGYGLAGLRARAAEVGGTTSIRSAPGDGTTVTVRLSVPPVGSAP